MKIRNLFKISLCLSAVLLITANVCVAQNNTYNMLLAKAATSENSYLSDTEITAKVKEKLISEKLFGKEKMPAMGIHVKTTKGIVYLKGKVSSQDQEDKAISLAKSVKGVKEVKSSIKIKSH